jgi:hypothetical protein
MYDTGLDPFTEKPVHVARAMHDRKLQRALMQFFKPENYFAVHEALTQAGRPDLIGDGCDCLIPSKPLKKAVESRRKHANQAMRADYYYALPPPAQAKKATVSNRCYRPGRKSQLRQQKPGRGSDA